VIKVDPDLKYSALMQVIDVFCGAFNEAKKSPNISFAELSNEELRGQ